MPDIRFGFYTIRHNPKPIPDRRWDWDFVHDDFDGADDSTDNRCGAAESVEACKAEIREIEEDWGNTCHSCPAITDDDGYSVDETCCHYCKAD